MFMFILSINQSYFWIDNLVLYFLTKKIQNKSKFGGFIVKKRTKKS